MQKLSDLLNWIIDRYQRVIDSIEDHPHRTFWIAAVSIAVALVL